MLHPDVIESWKADANGEAWTLTVREGTGADTGRPSYTPDWIVQNLALATLEKSAPGIDSSRVLGGRQLRIFISPPADTLPAILADPALVVSQGLATEWWNKVVIPARGRLPIIEIELPLKSDPRDALDRGADLMVTRDPALLEYAAGRPMFRVFPLPWSRTYVLLQPAGPISLQVGRTQEDRRSLARDAVQVDARAAEPLPWWEEDSACFAPPAESPPASARIAYVDSDEVGRALAERVVAVAPPGLRLRSVGLDPVTFGQSLRGGRELAYISAVPRRTFDRCRELSGWPRGVQMVPLIDTRAHAIVRQGAPPLVIDWDGTVRVAAP